MLYFSLSYFRIFAIICCAFAFHADAEPRLILAVSLMLATLHTLYYDAMRTTTYAIPLLDISLPAFSITL